MPEPTVAYLVHSIPGRTRLRLPTLRDDMPRLQALALTMAALPGVRSADVSAVTASLLVWHDTPVRDLLTMSQGLFVVSEETPPGPDWSAVPLAPSVLPAAGALATAGLAVVQLLRGDPLPPALTLGMHAVSLARQALRAGRDQTLATPDADFDPD